MPVASKARREKTPKTCPVCDADFRGRKNQVYCRTACKWKAWDHRHPRMGIAKKNSEG